MSVFITGSLNESNKSCICKFQNQCSCCKVLPPVALRKLKFPNYPVEIRWHLLSERQHIMMTGGVSLVNFFFFFFPRSFRLSWTMSLGVGQDQVLASGFLCPAWLQSHLGPRWNLRAPGHPISLYWPHKLWAEKCQVKGAWELECKNFLSL